MLRGHHQQRRERGNRRSTSGCAPEGRRTRRRRLGTGDGRSIRALRDRAAHCRANPAHGGERSRHGRVGSSRRHARVEAACRHHPLGNDGSPAHDGPRTTCVGPAGQTAELVVACAIRPPGVGSTPCSGHGLPPQDRPAQLQRRPGPGGGEGRGGGRGGGGGGMGGGGMGMGMGMGMGSAPGPPPATVARTGRADRLASTAC